jgi:hypothetical protein
MSAKLPPLKIAATVDTSGVAAGIRDAEKRVRASAARMKASQAATGMGRAAATPALGMLGGGALGAGVGALGAFGTAGGVAGIAIAALVAPLLVATKVLGEFVEATKGSREQLRMFNETGKKTSTLPSATLAALAKSEDRTREVAGGPSLTQAFISGGGGKKTGLEQFAKDATEGARIISALYGAVGADRNMSSKVTELRAFGGASSSEGQAAFFAAQADAEARREQLRSGTYTSIGPRDVPYLRSINRNTQ